MPGEQTNQDGSEQNSQQQSTAESLQNQSRDPSSSTEGKSQENQSTEAPSQTTDDSLPENMRGKSAKEIADMYINLEKKHGELSNEVHQARELKKDMNVVLESIYSNPNLYKQVEKEIKKRTGQDTSTSNEGSGEDTSQQSQDGEGLDDVRQAERNRTIADFEKKFGLSEMETEKKSDLNKKIAQELAELVDPGGTKPMREIIRSIPVSQLEKQLEKAFWLAQKDSIFSDGNVTAQDISSIGSLHAASNQKSGTEGSLTEDELKVARSLGISAEEYAKRKKEINE